MDNTTLNAGQGGDVIATDELTTLNGGAVSAVKVQRVKVGYGVDGSLIDVTAAFPFPSNMSDGTNVAKISTAGEQIVSFTDLLPAAQSITAQDIVSTAVSGANGQSIVTGAPTAGSVASVAVSGDSSFAIQISGTWTGTLAFERSLDAGTTYTPIGAFSAGTSFITATVTQNGAFHGNAASATNIRVRSTAAWTGTASVKLLAGAGGSTITVGNPLRLFDKVSGVEHSIKAASTAAVTTDTGLVVTIHPSSAPTAAQPVTGTFFQATQPVSLATNTPTIAAGTAVIGRVGIDQTTPGTTNAVSVTNASFGATLAAETTKVIGTVNIATPTAFTLSSAATTNATSVKATAGTAFQIVASNVGAAAAFLKVFNLAVAPTVGTSVPLLTIPIAASGMVTIPFGTLGMRFGTGIALSITNLVADADATAVAAAQVKVAIAYI